LPDTQGPEEMALQLAVEYVNNDRSVLPNHNIEYVKNMTGIISTFDSIQKGKYGLTEVRNNSGKLASLLLQVIECPFCAGYRLE
jgi:hypothetical protein